MPAGRPAIAAALKRALFEEAGYRCAIPTCRGTSALQMAHIAPWAEGHEDRFENMIVLCAVDHDRYDIGQIPRASIRNFKANLSVVNARYSDFEKRLIEWFADVGMDATLVLDSGPTVRLMLRNLTRDGLLDETSANVMRMVSSTADNPIRTTIDADGRHRIVPGAGFETNGISRFSLTAAGKEFLAAWIGASPLELSPS